MSTYGWWNETDRGNQTYWQINQFQWHFIGFQFGNLLL